MGLRPCRIRVGTRDQEILGEERMALKTDRRNVLEILMDCEREWRVMDKEKGELKEEEQLRGRSRFNSTVEEMDED